MKPLFNSTALVFSAVLTASMLLQAAYVPVLAADSETMFLSGFSREDVASLEACARSASLDFSLFPDGSRTRRRTLVSPGVIGVKAVEKYPSGLIERARLSKSSYLRGLAQYVAGHQQQAADELVTVCEPDNSPLLADSARPIAFYILGNCYLALGDTVRSAVFLDKAAMLQPDDVDFAVGRAAGLVWSRKHEDAAEELERVLNRLAQDRFKSASSVDVLLYRSAVWDFLGKVRELLHDLSKSQECFVAGEQACDESLKSDRTDLDVLQNKAVLLRHHGDSLIGLSQFSKARPLLKESIRLCSLVIKTSPRLEPVHTVKAAALIGYSVVVSSTISKSSALAPANEALVECNEAIKLAPDSVEALAKKVMALRRLSMLEMALRHPENALWNTNQGIKIAEQIVAEHSNQGWPYLCLALAISDRAEAQAQLKENGKALTSWREAIAVAEKGQDRSICVAYPYALKAWILWFIALQLSKDGKYVDALKTCEDALEQVKSGEERDSLDPKLGSIKAVVLQEKARIRLLQKTDDESIGLYLRAIEDMMHLGNYSEDAGLHVLCASSYMMLARAQKSIGRESAALFSIERAVDESEQALKLEPNYIQAFKVRGQAQLFRGNLEQRMHLKERAVQSYRWALTDLSEVILSDPSDAYAKRSKAQAAHRIRALGGDLRGSKIVVPSK